MQIKSFCYCIFISVLKKKPKPGRFNVEKAKKLNIPEGKLWNKLQKWKYDYY